jgi:hypothetical protein
MGAIQLIGFGKTGLPTAGTAPTTRIPAASTNKTQGDHGYDDVADPLRGGSRFNAFSTDAIEQVGPIAADCPPHFFVAVQVALSSKAAYTAVPFMLVGLSIVPL